MGFDAELAVQEGLVAAEAGEGAAGGGGGGDEAGLDGGRGGGGGGNVEAGDEGGDGGGGGVLFGVGRGEGHAGEDGSRCARWWWRRRELEGRRVGSREGEFRSVGLWERGVII